MTDTSSTGSRHLGEIFRTLAHQMQKLFSETLRHVDHPLELGIARERLLVEYLRRFLPERYGIDTGFVIDSKDNISKQIDVVIYDKVVSPVFEIPGKIKYFPCECVVVVGEVKSTITDRETLSDALGKIRSVQELDHFSDKTNLEVAVHGAHGHFKVEIPPTGLVPIPYRTLSFIFTSRSMSRDTMVNELKSFCSSNPKQYWPNMVVDFENYLISYVAKKGSKESLELFPDNAVGLYATKPEEKDNIVLLFACLLGNFLTVARVVRPMVLNYFGVGSSKVDMFEL